MAFCMYNVNAISEETAKSTTHSRIELNTLFSNLFHVHNVVMLSDILRSHSVYLVSVAQSKSMYSYRTKILEKLSRYIVILL